MFVGIMTTNFNTRVIYKIKFNMYSVWRKLHSEEVNDLYSSPNIVRVIKSRRMRWAGHVARLEGGRAVHKVLVGKPEGRRTLGRPRRKWEDNIKMEGVVRTGWIWLRIRTGSGRL